MLKKAGEYTSQNISINTWIRICIIHGIKSIGHIRSDCVKGNRAERPIFSDQNAWK